jgi:uncharacterized membrane protein
MAWKTLEPTWFERLLALICGLLALTVAVAVFRGMPQWPQIGPTIWVHLATVMLAVVLTPAILLMQRGTRLHRAVGAVWMMAMLTTAIVSLFVRTIRPGHLSPIHFFSFLVLFTVPRAFWFAHRHQIDKHRRAILSTIIGALLIAGWLTFLSGRLLWWWLFK